MADYGLTIYNDRQEPVYTSGDNVLSVLKSIETVNLAYQTGMGSIVGSLPETTIPLTFTPPANAILMLGRSSHKTNHYTRDYPVIGVLSYRFSGRNLIIKPQPLADGYGAGDLWESAYRFLIASNQAIDLGAFGVSDVGVMPCFVKSRAARINFPAFGYVSLGAHDDEIPIVRYSSSYFCPLDSNTIRGDRIHSGFVDVLYVKEATKLPENNYGVSIYNGANRVIVTNDLVPLQFIGSYPAENCTTKQYISTAGIVMSTIPWFTDILTERVYYDTISMRVQNGKVDYQRVRSKYYPYTTRDVTGSAAVNETFNTNDEEIFYAGTFMVIDCKNIT